MFVLNTLECSTTKSSLNFFKQISTKTKHFKAFLKLFEVQVLLIVFIFNVVVAAVFSMFENVIEEDVMKEVIHNLIRKR